jgi:hypothetical protein
MHEGQQQFLQFFLDAVEDGQQEQAKQLLFGAFGQMQAGTFDYAAFDRLKDQLLAIVKPDKQAQVQAAMAKFASTLK